MFGGGQIGVAFTTIPSSVDLTVFVYLYRLNLATSAVTYLFDQTFDVNNITTADGGTGFVNLTWNGIADTVATPGNYRYYWTAAYGKSGSTSGITTMFYRDRSLLVQTLKR